VALDGDAKNSPFTLALLHNIATPGLDLRIAFGRVRDEVLKTTDRQQEPFVYGSLGGSVISIVDAPKIPPPLSTDEIVWNAIKDSGYPAIFEDFISKFPSSAHLADADRRRDELRKQIAAAQAPPPPAADDIVWNAIKQSRDPAIFEEFVSKYSASPHLADARQRRDDLKKQIADATSRVPPPPATDEIVWDAIKDARTAAIFEEYLSKFPDSAHGAVARTRFDELHKQEELKQEEVKQRQVAALAPLPPPAPREQAALNGIDLKLEVLEVAAEAGLKPKAVFKECDKCPEMVVVPAGSFMMGSAENESHREAVEGPQHRVTVAHRFAAGRFAVTFDEWDACVADGGCNGYRPWDNGWGRGKRPVISVSWQDAKNYVAWLSQRTGKSYRLLSEAEREYVTRAGTTSPFWWGTSVSRRNANYDDKSAKDKPANAASGQKTLPVDSFQPNPWGFYQVSGNVWEWVEDCMNDDYAGAPADGTPRLSGNCQRRVLRGGSWISEAFMLRSAGRYGVQADGRVGNVGFRVTRELND
jgi:formylglycine-generating enzyme required for sulfatase activity